MSLLIQAFIAAWLAYLAIELLFYWTPLMAFYRQDPTESEEMPALIEQPTFCILTPCRDGAECIPGLVESFQKQTYPSDKFKLALVADHCTDTTAQVARAMGMDVYERHAPAIPGKGNAVSDMLRHHLHKVPFDVLVVLDIDARVEPTFLEKM